MSCCLNIRELMKYMMLIFVVVKPGVGLRPLTPNIRLIPRFSRVTPCQVINDNIQAPWARPWGLRLVIRNKKVGKKHLFLFLFFNFC